MLKYDLIGSKCVICNNRLRLYTESLNLYPKVHGTFGKNKYLRTKLMELVINYVCNTIFIREHET
jgi:hypothetical protein